jgi:hypothetical protein
MSSSIALLLGGAFHLRQYSVVDGLRDLRLPAPRRSVRLFATDDEPPTVAPYDVVTYRRSTLNLADFYPPPADSWWSQGSLRVHRREIRYSWGPGGETGALLLVNREVNYEARQPGVTLVSGVVLTYALHDETEETTLTARWVTETRTSPV